MWMRFQPLRLNDQKKSKYPIPRLAARSSIQTEGDQKWIVFSESSVWTGFCQTTENKKMAEEEGFEPPIPFQVRQFSRLEQSTTRPLFLS